MWFTSVFDFNDIIPEFILLAPIKGYCIYE